MNTVLPTHHQPRADAYRRAGWWQTAPVSSSLREHARLAPSRIALVDRFGTLSYGELEHAVQRLACALWAHGLRPGQVLALQLPNRREFVLFQQAAARLGIAYLPLIPQLRSAELLDQLKRTRAAALVVPAQYRGFDHLTMATDLQIQMPDLKVFVTDTSVPVPAGTIAVDSLLDAPWEHKHADAVEAIVVDPDALRAILFTSGTESRPKGVLHNWNTLHYPLRLHRELFTLGHDDAVYTCSPVGHGTGAIFGVELALYVGAKLVLEEQWNADGALQTLAREGCSMMWGATTFYTDLVAAAETAGIATPQFRYAFSAGAPIPRDLVLQVRERLGAQLIAAYGQSEGQNIAINRPDDPLDKITGSDGRFNPGIEYKLVDNERQAVAAGDAGEIAYRGPNVCLGYLDDEHTAAAFDAEGFVYSGDLGVIDADGYLRIVGRRKEIIIRGGENISPREIEDLLFGAPGIAEISVVGLPDERLGQRACAVVVTQADTVVTLQTLIEHLAQRQIAKFKYPERLVIAASLPRTASGKVQKEVLRRQILDGSLA